VPDTTPFSSGTPRLFPPLHPHDANASCQHHNTLERTPERPWTNGKAPVVIDPFTNSLRHHIPLWEEITGDTSRFPHVLTRGERTQHPIALRTGPPTPRARSSTCELSFRAGACEAVHERNPSPRPPRPPRALPTHVGNRRTHSEPRRLRRTSAVCLRRPSGINFIPDLDHPPWISNTTIPRRSGQTTLVT
jgi:hypothetical protein